MSQDVEKFEPTADLQPIHGPGPFVGNASYNSDLPDYLEIAPPYGPTNGLKDTIDRYWSHAIRWPRALVIAFLWVTYSVWRFGYIAGTALLVILLIVNR